MSNFVYEKRAVLFLDILGFKELIDTGQEQKIYSVLTTSSEFSRAINSAPEMFKATAFSDSLVVSCKLDKIGVRGILNAAAILVWSFLRQGILTRGGISCGDMHHTKDRLFGPAMNSAYKLESEFAIFPRVLVSDEVVSMIRRDELDGTVTAVGLLDPAVLRQDFDGQWHIHFMNHHLNSPFSASITEGEKVDIFNSKVKLVESCLNCPSPSPGKNMRALAKHNWLRNYMQSSIIDFDSMK